MKTGVGACVMKEEGVGAFLMSQARRRWLTEAVAEVTQLSFILFGTSVLSWVIVNE